ncbi:hypothetical protein O6H91_09G075600 [Diphasiastrum complanatum]|uniref:Uncharacterized protein n=2 Tax=Diphasiastrum complanatum TaxID=34168 RepID=A0ACC2CR26_DIPCM|nr:hypothetical protein O6H91_09G075600 [Diphasiastrum complanatum]
MELEKLRHYTEQKVTLDMQLRSVLADLKLEQDQLAACVMEKDKMLHRVKHAEHFLKQIQATIPSLEIEKQKVNRKLVTAEHERKRVSLSVAELKKEMDIRMHNYLQIENLQKETVLTLHSDYKKVEHLEKEVIHTIELEYAQQQQTGELASLREHMCRLLSSKLNSLTIAELKEKSTLLEVEHNMLQNEVLNKDQLLIRIRKDLTINIQNQFHLRSELIKCIESLSRTKERANEYVIEVEKLRSIISNTEKEMTAFRVQYEMWVITRNHIGISLIDRNDELCILFEKSHTQEELLKHSQIELVKRDNEIACLKPQLSDLERAIILCYKFIPQAVNIFRTKKQLKHQLRLVIEEGERLSELVEQPENTARWRLLVGTDTKEVELVAKISHIEQRLSETANRELQKDLILEEVTALSADLKKHAAEGWEENIALEKRVNYYQQRMRTVTQQMMATVSELSLCQAMAMNVQQEKETLLKTLEEAYSKFTVAEPPTEDAQKEWVRMEKTLFLNELAETDFKQNALKTGKSWSTVEQRPNAYISEEYGLPKPFGAHAPFKP